MSKTIGDRIRTTREAKVMSQQELAVAAGISRVHVNRLEMGGRKTPRPATIRALATALDVDPKWLRDGEEPRPARPSPEDT